jgi:hypothetical protein
VDLGLHPVRCNIGHIAGFLPRGHRLQGSSALFRHYLRLLTTAPFIQYNLVQPISLGRSITTGQPLVNPLLAHVQPQYYGGLVITEAIGTTGSSTIVELTINDPYMSGYAIYEHGSIARAVFINSLAYFSADSAAGTNRSSTHVSLAGMSGQMTIKRTGIMHADDTQNLTWAGQSFETRDATASGAIVQQTVDVSKGVDVSATEAVLLTFV